MSIKEIKKTSSLLDLFPSKPDAEANGEQTKKTIDNLKILLAISKEALANFQKGNLSDPTVGENACQIRAARFSALANHRNTEQKITETLKNISEAEEGLSEVNLPRRESTSLTKVLQNKKVNLKVPTCINEIIAAYILELARTPERKIEKIDNKVDYSEIIKENKQLQNKGFPKSVAQNVEKKAKGFLADQSINYLQKQLEKSPEKDRRLSGLISESHIKTTKYGLKTAPGLPSVEICLKSALRKGTPLALKLTCVDSSTVEKGEACTLFYKPNANGTQFISVDGSEIASQAVIALDAACIDHPLPERVSVCNRIRGKNIVDEIILPCFAAHPQYGGDLKNTEGPEDKKTRELQEYALQEGLCKENQTFCRIYHVYAEKFSPRGN